MNRWILLVSIFFTNTVFADFSSVNIKPNLSCHGISEMSEGQVIALLFHTKSNGIYITAMGDTSFSYYYGKTASVGVNGYAYIEAALKDHLNFYVEGEELWRLTQENVKGKVFENLKGTISTWGQKLGEHDYNITCSGILLAK